MNQNELNSQNLKAAKILKALTGFDGFVGPSGAAKGTGVVRTHNVKAGKATATLLSYPVVSRTATFSDLSLIVAIAQSLILAAFESVAASTDKVRGLAHAAGFTVTTTNADGSGRMTGLIVRGGNEDKATKAAEEAVKSLSLALAEYAGAENVYKAARNVTSSSLRGLLKGHAEANKTPRAGSDTPDEQKPVKLTPGKDDETGRKWADAIMAKGMGEFVLRALMNHPDMTVGTRSNVLRASGYAPIVKTAPAIPAPTKRTTRKPVAAPAPVEVLN